MKVLFAVSNENISEAIIKKYPKEYREILSYKNVYYFNAILKEIQKDKSYDRIVISEDLEPFINSNHESIDNFIFEHLDRISDEAHDNEGKETSIILICSERRAPGSSILNKLFSIGVYNAVMGKDRNLQELCSLINRPRTKKEAKQYYRIDQATYDPASESEVNEVEIQNILTHFKKLGKNTERYADSFNNIAAQYTDEQLKIIIKVLPMKVKAVLEVDSPKYQALMGSKPVQRVIPENKELGIKVNTIGKQTQINGPIVIPSSVRKSAARPAVQNEGAPKVEEKTVVKVQREVTPQVSAKEPVKTTEQTFVKQQTTTPKTSVIQPIPMKQTVAQVRVPEVKKANPTQEVNEQPLTNGTRINQSELVRKPSQEEAKTQVGQNAQVRPNVQARPTMANSVTNPNAGVRGQVVVPASVQKPVGAQNNAANTAQARPQTAQNTITAARSQLTPNVSAKAEVKLETQVTPAARPQVVPNVPVEPKADAMFDDDDLLSSLMETVEEPEITDEVKRGRGRPKKLVEEPQKPKGKRGRPRKFDPENNTETEEDNFIPEIETSVSADLDELLDFSSSEDNLVEMPVEETIVPQIDNNDFDELTDDIFDGLGTEDDNVLPGMEEISEVEEDSLSGVSEDEDLFADFGLEEETLPGLDTEVDEISIPELEDDNFGFEEGLPGMEDDNISGLDELEDLPGLEENIPEVSEGNDEVDVSSLLAGLDEDEDAVSIPGLDDLDDITLPEEDEMSVPVPGLEEPEDVTVPGLNGLDDLEDITIPGLDDDFLELPSVEEEPEPIPTPQPVASATRQSQPVTPVRKQPQQVEEATILPGMGFEDISEDEIPTTSNIIDAIKPKYNYSVSNLNSLLTPDKKIAAFVGTTKNGTSFLVNNLALMFSLQGIDTAVLDMTKNRNSYYIFTDSKEELRNITYTSLSKLENGYAEGIKFNKNLTIYTALPSDEHTYDNAEPILSTLVQNHSLVLIDCDFDTPPAYFASCQEIYLVQSMDILTIQPLTAFLRELKFKGAWEPEKARVVINKELNIGRLNGKMIIAGMSRYNGPDMSVMTDLFNKDMVKACSIPFDEKVYSKYLETMATCKLSLSGYSKMFRQRMEILSEMVYPKLNSKKSFGGPVNNAPPVGANNVFSNNMNSTLNQMKNKF